METQLSTEHEQYMRIIMKEMKRTEFTINDFLNYAKPEMGNVELISLHHMIKEVINIFTNNTSIDKIAFTFAIEKA